MRGEYELLEKCGGAMNCLHRRVGDGAPLFLFLDPHRIGAAEHDSVVFATSAERVGYGETRRTVASLDASWWPWTSGDSPPASRSEAVHCIVRGAWAAAPKASLPPAGDQVVKRRRSRRRLWTGVPLSRRVRGGEARLPRRAAKARARCLLPRFRHRAGGDAGRAARLPLSE